jgi:hypothetical protein
VFCKKSEDGTKIHFEIDFLSLKSYIDITNIVCFTNGESKYYKIEKKRDFFLPQNGHFVYLNYNLFKKAIHFDCFKRKVQYYDDLVLFESQKSV